jgi:hypothetical protein
MFRARIYAQGFTLLALVAGSIFYKDERIKRKVFEGAVEEKKAAEKRDKWIKELEARDREDKEWRDRIENPYRDVKDEAKAEIEKIGRDAKEVLGKVTGEAQQEKKGGFFSSKSVREGVTRSGWGEGTWVARTREAWRRL